LRKEIGYSLGKYHHSILSPETGILPSAIAMLSTYEGVDAMLGYNIWRQWYFLDAEPHEIRRTEWETQRMKYLKVYCGRTIQDK
jgi:hypothetical protein